MASYHLCVKNISRGSGKSVVASAAYRSRSELKLEREGVKFDYSKYNGKDHNHRTLNPKSSDNSVVSAAAYRSRSKIENDDYSRKTDLGFSEIMLPKLAPEWMLDRSKLWNHVEDISPKNGRLAREIEIALPIELSLEQNIKLVKEFVNENFISEGMVADVNIHNLEHNPHSHILLSTRYVTKNGFGTTNRYWNRTKNVNLWREKWSSIANYHLAKAGSKERIDHRSYKDRGIDLIPQIKIGRDREDKVERTKQLQENLIENGKNIINDPTIALKYLTEHKSTFSHEDILKFVNGHSHHTQFNEVVAAIENCPGLKKITKEGDEQQDKFTSSEIINIETNLELSSIQLSHSRTHNIKEKHIRKAIKKCGLSSDQGEALEQTIHGNDLSVIIGYAGSGKSYTLRGINQAYTAAGYNVSGVALSGIAVDSLENSSGIQSTTIHRKLKQWEKGKERLTPKSVIIIDEGGTVGTRQMQKILTEVAKAGAKIILVGDPNQTQAIQAGDAFRIVLKNSNTKSVLNKIWRQQIEWQAKASKLFAGERNDIFAALDKYKEHGRVKDCADINQAMDRAVNDFLDGYSLKETRLILAHTKKVVKSLNEICRDRLKRETKILKHQDYVINTVNGKKYFCVNDRILFLNGDDKLRVKNGSFGTIKSIDSHGIIVTELDNKNRVVFDVRRYNAIDHGYSATINRTQGATIDRSYFIASEGTDRHLSYVAMTRHRKDAYLYYSKDLFQNYEHLKQRSSNLARKENVTDYKSSQGILEGILSRFTSKNVLFKLDDRIKVEHPEIKDHVVPIVKNYDGSISYTTDVAIETERQMYQNVYSLSTKKNHALGTAGIDKLSRYLFAKQSHIESFEKILCGNDLTVLSHGIIDPTDKTYFLKTLKDVYQDLGYVVQGISLSGLGADNLEAAGIESATVSKKLWEWENQRNHLTGKSVLIVDNANMIGTESMQKILEQAETNNSKLILVGNRHLLPPIDSGAPLRGIIEKYSGATVELKSEHQTPSNWRQEVSEMLIGDRKSVSVALDMCVQKGTVFCLDDDFKAKDMLVLDWLRSEVKSKMIVAQSKTAAESLNSKVHNSLKENREIGTEEIQVNGIGISTGEKIMFLKGDRSLGVQNGTIGTVGKIEGSNLYVVLGSDRIITVDTKAYNNIKYGYAINTHKLADRNYDKLFIHATSNMDRHSVATAFQSGKNVTWYHAFDSNYDFRSKLSREHSKALLSDFWQNPLSKEAQSQSLSQLKRRGINADFWSNEKDGRSVKGIYNGIIKLNDHKFARFEESGKTILSPYKNVLDSQTGQLIKYDPNNGKITKAKEHYYELTVIDKNSGRKYQTKTSCKVFDSKDVETAQRNAAAEFCKKAGIRSGNVEASFKRFTYFEGQKVSTPKIEQRRNLGR